MSEEKAGARIIREYWKLVAVRAFRDKCVLLGLDSVPKVVVRVAMVAIGLTILWLLDSQDAAAGSLWGRIALTAAVMLLFPLLFAINFLRAPSPIHAEQNARLAVLDDKKAKQAIIDDLAQLHAIGQQNFSAKLTSDDDLKRWIAAVNEWCRIVSDFLKEKVSVAQQLSFDHAQQTLRTKLESQIQRFTR